MNAISDKILTAEQFLTMEKDEHAKYELIDGIICMSPSPTFEHQKVSCWKILPGRKRRCSCEGRWIPA